MTVMLDGHSLKAEDVVRVARNREPIKLHDEAIARINKCRGLLDRKIKAREIMYGVNTGIGELSEVILTTEQVEKFQRYLLERSCDPGFQVPFILLRPSHFGSQTSSQRPH